VNLPRELGETKTKKNYKFTICVMAISYNAHACSLYVIPRG